MLMDTQTLEDSIIKAKKNREEAEKLISMFKPFIASVIQKKVGKYLRYGSDDELSIGLMAFNEAINSYDINKGKFLSFARLVIINRLIDYYRKQAKYNALQKVYDTDESDDYTADLIDKESFLRYEYDNEAEDRKFEIIEYSRVLKEWGISFNELVNVCPKHDNLRRDYKKIAKLIAGNEELLEELKKSKRLPINKIEKLFPLHRKKIERGRIYIIALVIVILNKFSFIDINDV